jgi:hypothetical protein
MVKSFNLFGRELFSVRVERNRLGEFSYEFMNGDSFQDNGKYLHLSLTNPVLMTIIALRSKIYSQMQIQHINARGEVVENSPYVKLLRQPNYFQSQEDFLFQQMWFLSSSGTNYTRQFKPFKSSELPTALFNLVPDEIDLNKSNELNSFIYTKADFDKIGERTIIYTMNGKKISIQLRELIPFYDLANGLQDNQFMQSYSRVKGIAKTLENINQNIKSKNINLQFSQKYIASNKSEVGAGQIQDDDRKAIYDKIDRKALSITNKNFDVKHMVSDMKRLFLDEQFSSDALVCLLAFDMNKDVLNFFGTGGSTFENQEKGELRYLQNSIQTTANNTMNSFSSSWGLIEKGEKLIAKYDHLNIMQPVINEKIKSLTELQNMIKIGKENGTITDADAIEMTKAMRLTLNL